MLKDAGEKIDWLSEADLPWIHSPEGQRWLNYLRVLEDELPNHHDEGDYHPNDVDQLAAFLTKEHRAGRIRRSAGDQDFLSSSSYEAPRLYDGSNLIRHIPKWAEYLRSREGSKIDPLKKYAPGEAMGEHDALTLPGLVEKRSQWDYKYSPDYMRDIYGVDQLPALEKAMTEREQERAHPLPDRKDIPSITPNYSWRELVRSLYDFPDDAEFHGDKLYNHAKNAEAIPELAQEVNRQHGRTDDPDGYHDDEDYYKDPYDHRNSLDPLKKILEAHRDPVTNEYTNEPYIPPAQLPGHEWEDVPYPWQQGAGQEPKVNPYENIHEDQGKMLRENPGPTRYQFSPEQIDKIKETYQGQLDRYPEWTFNFDEGGEGHDWWRDEARYDPAVKEQIGEAQPIEPWEYNQGQARWARFKPKNPHHRKPHIGQSGRICHCYYGHKATLDREHVGHVKESAQLDQLKKRPDVKGHPEAEHLIPILEAYDKKWDKYLPWIVREFKNGNLQIPPDVSSYAQKAKKYQEFLNQHREDLDNYDPDGDEIHPDSKSYESEDGWYYGRGRDLSWNATNVKDQLSRYYRHGFQLAQEGIHPTFENESHYMGDHFLPRLNDWYENLKKQKLAPPIVSKDMPGVADASHAIHEWESKQDEARRKTNGEILHTFPEGPSEASQGYREGEPLNTRPTSSEGWTMRLIRDADEARMEGRDMDHCIGKEHYGYPKKISEGRDEAWHLSLRDPENWPHATLQIDPKRFRDKDGNIINWEQGGSYPASHFTPVIESGANIQQAHGPSDYRPKPPYANMVDEFLEHHGMRALDSWGDNPYEHEEFEPWWDYSYTADGPEDASQYFAVHGGPSQYTGEPPEAPEAYYNAHSDADEHGHDGPELEYEEPNWESMVNNLFDRSFFRRPPRNLHHDQPSLVDPVPYDPYKQGLGKFDQDQAKALHDSALVNGHWHDLIHEGVVPWLENNGYEPDESVEQHPDYTGNSLDQAAQYWTNLLKQHTDPVTRQIEHPDILRGQRQPGVYTNPYENVQYQTAWDKWWNEQGQQAHMPTLPQMEQYAPQAPSGQLPPGVQPGMAFSRIAALSTPLYYRWVFHPSSGEVTLDHNGLDHPAQTKTHRDLHETEDSMHGYAYRIHGGWRLTDYEHNPVSDPFIVAQVVQAIRGEDGRKQSAEGTWQFIKYDFDKLHCGRPIEKESKCR